MLFLHKFHCELNAIKRVWGHAKRFTRANCDYTFKSLRKTVPEAMDSIPVEITWELHVCISSRKHGRTRDGQTC